MNAMILDIGAVALCGLSVMLIKETSTYSLSDHPIKYEAMITERKGKRVLIGRLLLVIAVLFAGMGLLAQFRGLLGLP